MSILAMPAAFSGVVENKNTLSYGESLLSSPIFLTIRIKMRKSGYVCLAAAGVALVGLDVAYASTPALKDYPTKPIRLIVPFAPGGGTDILARLTAQKLGEAFKQAVIVDNRAGGGGTMGVEMAVRATPDGYTMLFMSSSYTTNAALLDLSYDPVNDILPIVLVGETPSLVVLHPGVPAKSINELIALAKTKPGALNYASGGIGTVTHLGTELFNLMTGVKMTHVSYKGQGPAMIDVIAGQVQVLFGLAPPTMPFVRSNRVRAIAITSSKRSAKLPDLPTVSEAGVAGYEVVVWFGVLGAKGLQKNIVARWNTDLRSALKTSDVTDRLVSEGVDSVDGSPEMFQGIVKRDIAKWRKVVKDANIKLNQ